MLIRCIGRLEDWRIGRLRTSEVFQSSNLPICQSANSSASSSSCRRRGWSVLDRGLADDGNRAARSGIVRGFAVGTYHGELFAEDRDLVQLSRQLPRNGFGADWRHRLDSAWPGAAADPLDEIGGRP